MERQGPALLTLAFPLVAGAMLMDLCASRYVRRFEMAGNLTVELRGGRCGFCGVGDGRGHGVLRTKFLNVGWFASSALSGLASLASLFCPLCRYKLTTLLGFF